MRTLVCGSLAYDTIMVFPDHFSRHILPDQAHVLSVSFQIGEMRREWGGCAGNIAYNLKQIGGEPVVMATVGDDGIEYKERLAALGIAVDGVRHVPGAYTGQAFIITDLDDNQITAFHPGAMNYSHQSRVSDVADIGLGIIAPDGKEGMRSHAAQFAQAGIPYIFDPGQGMTLFDGPELMSMINTARYVAVNDYEGRMLAERTGVPLAQLAEHVEALIVTLGADGSVIHSGGETYNIPAAKCTAVLDPTGCGDAYRAGILYGIAHGWDWERTGGLASVLGAIKIASRGAQKHALSRDSVATLYKATFGSDLW
jgi:adenosine kinase